MRCLPRALPWADEGCPVGAQIRAWPASSLHRWIQVGVDETDEDCTHRGPLAFDGLDETAMELGLQSAAALTSNCMVGTAHPTSLDPSGVDYYSVDNASCSRETTYASSSAKVKISRFPSTASLTYQANRAPSPLGILRDVPQSPSDCHSSQRLMRIQSHCVSEIGTAQAARSASRFTSQLGCLCIAILQLPIWVGDP